MYNSTQDRALLLAFFCFVAAVAVQAAFGCLMASLYFATFYPAVLIAAVYGGVVAGSLVAGDAEPDWESSAGQPTAAADHARDSAGEGRDR